MIRYDSRKCCSIAGSSLHRIERQLAIGLDETHKYMEEVENFIFNMDLANMVALVGIYVVRIFSEKGLESMNT